MTALLRRHAVSVVLLAGVLTACASPEPKPPVPDHVVIVVLENHGFSEIIDGGQAPFIRSLARQGALFTRSYALMHPSEPNYLALFSGSTQGVGDDGNYSFDAPSLAGALRGAGFSFLGYAEPGSPRAHNPWESFWDSVGAGRDLRDFPTDFRRLPTVSLVVPNLEHDMHDGSIETGDAWLRKSIGPYADWARANNSLLILTFDEDDERGDNRIPTIFVGGMIAPGRYDERIDHLRVLRTIETMYGLPPLGRSAEVRPITSVWARPMS